MYTINLQFDKLKITASIHTSFTSDMYKWNVDRHSNLQYELHIAMCGSSVIDVEKNQYEIKRGKALLISPGRYHSACRTSDDYSHFVISFSVSGDESAVTEFVKIAGDSYLIDICDSDMIICKKIITETTNKGLFWKESLYALYSVFFVILIRNFKLNSYSLKKENVFNDDNRFSLIDNFFEQNLSQNCSEEDLASKLNLSKRQLNRILMMNYGMGFREKMHNSRMDRAQWLLRTTDISVSDICEKIGYNSEASFFKAFKKHSGISPGKYRESDSATNTE